VRNALAKRASAEERYPLDQSRVRELIVEIMSRNGRNFPATEISFVEVYTRNRYCAAISLNDNKSVIFDYGFIELLSDNIGIEHLTYHSERLLREWFTAGQPEGGLAGDGPDRFVVGGVEYNITGTMMMRDVACKLIENIVPETEKRERLTKRLLWRSTDGVRPNAPYYLFLTGPENQADVLPAFVADPEGGATLADQTVLSAAFVACHEISHLVFTDDDRDGWNSAGIAAIIPAIFERLCDVRVEGERGTLTLRDLTQSARLAPDVQKRVLREALTDIRAVEMMIGHRSQESPNIESWSNYFANVFALVSMGNSLTIFRNHLAASIHSRSVDMPDIELARSEAVSRNLYVLAYLLHRNEKLAGKKLAADLLAKIHEESLVLQRRMVYFYMDLVASVSADDWKGFIDSALS
jgi:hypothetical protein